ncbi:MAG: HEAT repeat domain-containing protein [Fuerstiella sp.]
MYFLLQVIMFGSFAASSPATDAAADSAPDRIPVLIAALDNPGVRYGASVALTRLGTKAVPALQMSLQSGKGEVPVWSAYTLGQIGPAAQTAVTDLIRALASSDDALRAAAAQALGRIGPPSAAAAAVDSLSMAVTDPQHNVRSSAVVALGQIGPAAAIATADLIDALSDSQLRPLARTALTKIGPATVNPLLKALGDDNIRYDASVVLLQVDPNAAREAGLDNAAAADLTALSLVLNDLTRTPAERTAAATALAFLKTDGVPVLMAAFENGQTARTAAQAFAKVGAVAAPALIDALQHANPEVRSTVIDALGHIGPAASEATPHLVQMLKDDDSTVRYRAVRALHEFEHQAQPAIPTLIEIINNAQESEQTQHWAIKTMLVTLPETHDVVVEALIAASREEVRYGVRHLARQEVLRIDRTAAEAAGIK